MRVYSECWRGRGGKLSRFLGEKTIFMNTLYLARIFYLLHWYVTHIYQLPPSCLRCLSLYVYLLPLSKFPKLKFLDAEHFYNRLLSAPLLSVTHSLSGLLRLSHTAAWLRICRSFYPCFFCVCKIAWKMGIRARTEVSRINILTY